MYQVKQKPTNWLYHNATHIKQKDVSHSQPPQTLFPFRQPASPLLADIKLTMPKLALKTLPSQPSVPSEAVCDIVTFIKTLPKSLSKRGNMPHYYTFRVDPNVRPVQHERCKIPIESRVEIEAKLQGMVNVGVIMWETRPTEWVSSLTYPQKPTKTSVSASILRTWTKPFSMSIMKPLP